MLSTITTILLIAYIAIQCCCLLALVLSTPDQTQPVPENELPRISILIAARNEERNIAKCLKAIQQLYYPTHLLDVWIGNDASEDKTADIVQKYIADKPHMHLLNITQPVGNAKGKANVLAQLAAQAQGEILFITDADITVNRNWVSSIVPYFSIKTMGLVSGTTVVKDKGYMGRMQEVDWLYFMGMLKAFANLGMRCTAVGNNMAVRKTAYLQTGGYENLPFSITEDYILYKEVRKHKWQTANILTAPSLNRSAAVCTFATLLQQRKRWLTGAKQLPMYWWLVFGLFGLFWPALLILAYYNPVGAAIIYGFKLSLQTATIVWLQHRLQIKKNIDYLLGFEYYSAFVSLATQVFFLLPIRIQWKKRSYPAIS